MLRRSLATLISFAASLGAQAQGPRVFIRTPGPAQPTAILRDALSRPHVLRRERWNVRLFRDSVFDRSVIVLGSDAAVASTIHGDLIVVEGDLFLRPGARVDGRVVVYGGGVYDSQQATVRGDRLAFRDVHFDIDSTGEGIALDYRPAARIEGPGVVTLPAVYGLRLPTYTRVDGLSLPWGPRVDVGDGRLVVDPTVTYRSDIGAFDLGIHARAQMGAAWSLEVSGERGTFTNDDWIRSDLANSLTVLLAGDDQRNYWRADRIEGRLARTWSGTPGQVALWGGGRTERDWSIAAGGPWSLTRRSARSGIVRFNPLVERGRLSSVLVGASGAATLENLTLGGSLTVEHVVAAPRSRRFTQITLDAEADFPTFGAQTFSLRSHVVGTTGDTALPQRFVYLGGGGTLQTFGLLQLGGDHLLFVEGMYNIPLGMIAVPLIGAPVISLRYALGAAGVGRLPALEQNLGARLTLGLAYVEYAVDPATRRSTVAAGLGVPVVR